MIKKIMKSYDYSLIVTIILLSIFGLVMVYSASMVTAIQRYGYESDFFYQKQKIHLLLALIMFLFFAIFPYKALKSNKIIATIMISSILILGGVYLFGHVAGNAQSWIKMGSATIQPSEFIKLAVIIYLSAVYAKKQSYINEFNKGVVPPLVYLIIVCFFVAIEPDYGTAAIIFLIAMTIVVSSGMNFKNLLRLAIIGLVFSSFLLLFAKDSLFSENKKGRFEAFKDPFAVEQKEGWQLVHSYLAIGSGGTAGLGLGQSIQKLGYLPEPHTDFIMAVISEELGVLGVSFVLLSLAYIVLRGIYTALKCKDPFGTLLAVGISSMIGIQSFINLAGITGLIPITGVPLPLVSYGGSSLLQLSISLGILVNVSMFVNYEKKYKNKGKQNTVKTVISTRNQSIRN
ncbi:FtsW/RodA/SpoVE family cell cycle protein [Bacillus aquiflavi]|uniref:Probable peptidoglycan glycosyltransferase FtsW n=1 Tax=Bacillus aquiflavi TaxID=2672567 RepID=A0A6B3W152_9BACI|nr:FtsW/RodA/SpoVE family cell cycle protein [Bacillus aquiflavi]MBA4537931.1 FtsW/RodA/SpoVE family cell cycle protein [Bacillus aquiflavi]NEY82187.1 FtsW/RodA/SpoVE family cell cycle protein [Bacillus aquiflavi]